MASRGTYWAGTSAVKRSRVRRDVRSQERLERDARFADAILAAEAARDVRRRDEEPPPSLGRRVAATIKKAATGRHHAG